VSHYQTRKNNLDFTEARDSEWQWYQLGHMQVCTSLQTDNPASTPPLSFFTGRMPFLLPNQQRQSTEGKEGKQIQKIIPQCQIRNIKQMAIYQIRFTLFFQYEHMLPNFRMVSASLSMLDFNIPCSIL